MSRIPKHRNPAAPPSGAGCRGSRCWRTLWVVMFGWTRRTAPPGDRSETTRSAARSTPPAIRTSRAVPPLWNAPTVQFRPLLTPAQHWRGNGGHGWQQ